MTGPTPRTAGFGLTSALCLLLAACQTPPQRSAPAPPAIVQPSTPEPAGSRAPSRQPPSASPRAPDETLQAQATQSHSGPAAETVFERLVAGFAGPTCGEEQAVARWLTRYRAPSRRIDDQLTQAADLLGHVLDHVEAAGLPTQFALIPFIESNYRPEAKGQGGPVGLWQIVPSTGRGLGLRIDSRFDGRLSVHQSTVAAIEHLGDLYRRFGDWRAAAMAYNAGEYRLLAALRAAGSDEISAERRLPPGLVPITYAYVAKLRALACLIASPERHALDFAKPSDRAAPAILVLPPGEFALPELATALGTDAAALRRLNGGHLGDRVRASSPRELLVAATAQPQKADLLALARAPALEHQVKSGDSLWKIARQHGLTLADLMAWNGIQPGTILKPGRLLRLAP